MITEDGKVVFEEAEQKEIDRIIGERLARAKGEKPADYDDLKEISDILEGFGYSGTPAEKKAAIKAYADSMSNNYQQEVQNQADKGEIPDEKVIEAMAKKFGVAPEKIEKAIKKQIDVDEAEESKKKQDEEWDKQEKELTEKYNDLDLDELAKNTKFIKFAQKRSGSLLEKYEEFIEFIGEAEAETIAKITSKKDRSTNSGKGGEGESGNYGLSQAQKDMLDEWNRNNPRMKMTAKEFKERLG